MSAEATKKRGRPKKVVLDSLEVEMPETTKKATTRPKSTTAAPKPATPKTTAQKPPQAPKSASKAAAAPRSSQKTSSKPSSQQTSKATHTPPPAPAKTTARTPVTPETSKILSQVRELSANNQTSTADSVLPPKSSPTTLKTQSVAEKTTTLPPPKWPAAQTVPPILPAKSPSPTPNQAPDPPPMVSQPPPPTKPTPKIPISSLNSQIVDNITTRAGARPNTSGSKNTLPPGYKSVARKVTMAIVAMPIVIVTSWVLYQRLILGEDRKLLVKPGLTVVEGVGEAGKGGESSRS